jgi:hypothetical protein
MTWVPALRAILNIKHEYMKILDNDRDVNSDVLSHLSEAARADLRTRQVSESEQLCDHFKFNQRSTYNGNQLIQHGIELWRANPFDNNKAMNVLMPAKSDEVSVFLIKVLASSLSGKCVDETPPEKGITFPFYLNSPLFPFPSHTFNSLLLNLQYVRRRSRHSSLCLSGPCPEAHCSHLPGFTRFPFPAGNQELLPEPSL